MASSVTTISAVSSRWRLLAAAGVAVMALACGDDDSAKNSNDSGNNGSKTDPLGANVAGKACTSDTDCGAGGTCADKQTLGLLSTLLQAITSEFESTIAAPGGTCTRACTNNADCGEGGVCFGALLTISPGECRKSCSATSDCRSPEYECAKQPEAPVPDGGVRDGGANGIGALRLPNTCQGFFKADQLTDNQTGLACDPDDAMSTVCGDGFCAAGSCTGICNKNADCGANGACIAALYGSVGLCAETCNADSDCTGFAQGGIGCNEADGQKLCGPKVFPLAPGIVGNACTADTQCSTGDCATALGVQQTPAPDGYCSLLGCSEDAQCGGGTCASSGLGSRCYKNCTSNDGCRTGYSCQPRAAVGMRTVNVCAPGASTPDAGTPVLASDAGTSTPTDAGAPDAS